MGAHDLSRDDGETTRQSLTSANCSGAGPQTQTPIEVFVEKMARDLAIGDRATDKRTRRVLRRLVDFATAQGLPLDREVILDPDSVERFVEVSLAGERSAATYRSTLRRVAPLLTRSAPWEPRPTSLGRHGLVAPYSEVEVKILCQDAALQPNESRRRAALALLALGLGAGLDGRWVAKVRATDVVKRGRFVIVSVGAPAARSVVVRAKWEHAVLDLASSAGSAFLVGGSSVSSNRTSHLTDSLVVPTGHPRLVPSRLRSTWLLGHLLAGTRLPEPLPSRRAEAVERLQRPNCLRGAPWRQRGGRTASGRWVTRRSPIDVGGGAQPSAEEFSIARQVIKKAASSRHLSLTSAVE